MFPELTSESQMFMTGWRSRGYFKKLWLPAPGASFGGSGSGSLPQITCFGVQLEKNRHFLTDLAKIWQGGSKYPRIWKMVSYGDSANSK